jgi:hypothetical protein
MARRMTMTVDVTPGGFEGHMWRVWLNGRLVCACSDINTLAFALGSIKLEVGK